MSDERSAVAEPQAPLNLTVHRVEQTPARRVTSFQPLPLLGLAVPAALLLSLFGRRARFRVPAAAALSAGAAAAIVTTMISRRRRSALEAAIDDRIEQSFPASDPASV